MILSKSLLMIHYLMFNIIKLIYFQEKLCASFPRMTWQKDAQGLEMWSTIFSKCSSENPLASLHLPLWLHVLQVSSPQHLHLLSATIGPSSTALPQRHSPTFPIWSRRQIQWLYRQPHLLTVPVVAHLNKRPQVYHHSIYHHIYRYHKIWHQVPEVFKWCSINIVQLFWCTILQHNRILRVVISEGADCATKWGRSL